MTRALLARVRRIVVKVGTSLLAPPDEPIQGRRFAEIARDVAAELERHRQIILVSSGAVGLGAKRLGLARRPTSIPAKQGAAAVGQIDLCRRYERAFARYGRHVGQILLTHMGLADRERFLNARHTLSELLAAGVVPIVNENDSVATEELRFGDNDRLAAQVVSVAEAQLLVILTDVEGLCDRPPGQSGGRRVPEVREVTPNLLHRVTSDGSSVGTGGMRSKLEAARIAASFGVPTVIVDGRRRGILDRVLAGDDVGTLVHPAPRQISSRKHWIAYSLRPRGSLWLDDGATRALQKQGRSLLPIGVARVEGEFRIGDLVRCLSPGGEEIARGLSSYGAAEIELIKGHRTSRISEILGYSNGDEIIHRDDLVVL